MNKICTVCKIEKRVEEFNKNKSKLDGYNTLCKECSRKHSKKYYKERGEVHKKNVVDRNSRYRDIIRDYILKYLNKNPCVDCGNQDVRVLEFDHLPEFDKHNNISTMMARSNSIKSIEREISKCEVVCANCHRIRTVNRSEKNFRK